MESLANNKKIQMWNTKVHALSRRKVPDLNEGVQGNAEQEDGDHLNVQAQKEIPIVINEIIL